MLAWKSTKKRYLPILICDVCHQQIKDPKQGNIVALRDDCRDLVLGWMVHKDKCDKKFTNMTHIYPWDELWPVMETVLKTPKFDSVLDPASLASIPQTTNILRGAKE